MKSISKPLCGYQLNINISGLYGKLNEGVNDLIYSGTVVFNGLKLSACELSKELDEVLLRGELETFLSQLSGFYSFIYASDEQLVVATDRIRSIPLVYSTVGRTVYISDSVSQVMTDLDSINYNDFAEYQLSRAGYVLGDETLIEQVKHVAAGEALLLDEKGVTILNYFDFLPENSDVQSTEEEISVHLDNALDVSIRELISVADGRQIVVPLSGGYDSRVIAVYLKKLGYKNVVTFTFGSRKSKEVYISKKIAGALSFDWHFVEYTKSRWQAIKGSSEFIDYLQFISNYTSVPNVQVFPAIKELFEQGVVDNDAILVPGHTGDFISGGHMPKSLFGLPAVDNEPAIVKAILAKHFKVKSKAKLEQQLHDTLMANVLGLIEVAPNNAAATSVFEAWEYRERQAKFIVNSNRYYDFYKLESWMPLWNKEFMNFWLKAPFTYRKNSRFWQKFIEDKYKDITNSEITYGNVSDQYSPRVNRLRTIFDYFTDENRLYSLVPFYRWVLRKLKYPYSKGTLFSYLAYRAVKLQKRRLKSLTK